MCSRCITPVSLNSHCEIHHKQRQFESAINQFDLQEYKCLSVGKVILLPPQFLIRMEDHSNLWGVWLTGRVDAFRPKGHGFDSHSSRHVATLGKSFTHSCCVRSASE